MENMIKNKIAVIDIETTGLCFKNDLIVEVGIVELDLKDGSINTVYDSVVKENGFCSDHKNSWIFKNSTLEFNEVMNGDPLDTNTLQNILDNYKVTAYKKTFDFNFLNHRGVSINNALDCPMILMTPICKIPHKTKNADKSNEYKWPSFQECWNYLFPDSDYVEAHRSADDAKHEAIVVYELINRGILKIK